MIIEVKQTQILHFLKPAAQFVVEPVKNFLRARNHLADFGERLQRRAVLWVNGQVPWTQFFEFQLPSPFSLQLAYNRHELLFHRLVKPRAIFRRIIEPAKPAKGIIAVIFEPGVLRDLPAELQHLVENTVELFSLLQAAPGDQFPCLLPQRAVRLFKVTPHLHQRFLLAAELDRERAA